YFCAGIGHLFLQVLGPVRVLILRGILVLGMRVKVGHNGLSQLFGFREGSKAVATTSSAASLSLSAISRVMRLACLPRSASETLFAAASVADNTASLAVSNPDCAALPAARFTPSLALPIRAPSALVSGSEAAMIAPIATPKPPISAALSRII